MVLRSRMGLGAHYFHFQQLIHRVLHPPGFSHTIRANPAGVARPATLPSVRCLQSAQIQSVTCVHTASIHAPRIRSCASHCSQHPSDERADPFCRGLHQNHIVLILLIQGLGLQSNRLASMDLQFSQRRRFLVQQSFDHILMCQDHQLLEFELA